MKKILIIFSMLLFSSNIQSEELSQTTWVKEWKTGQEFHSETAYLKSINEVKKIDSKSMVLPKLYNELADIYVEQGNRPEANVYYLKAMRHGEYLTDDVEYAYRQIKKHGLNIPDELERITLEDLQTIGTSPNSISKLGEILTVKLEDNEKQDIIRDLEELRKVNLIESIDDIAYLKGYTLMRTKKKPCCEDCAKVGSNCVKKKS